MRPLLRQCRIVDDQDGVSAADKRIGLAGKLELKGLLVPDPIRHEVMELVVIARRHSLSHRTHALAIAWPNQPRHIERTHPSPRLMAELGQERRQPIRKLSSPIRHAPRSSNQSAKLHLSPANKLSICQSSARQDLENNLRSHDAQARSRYWEWNAAGRSSIAIYDLIDTDTMQERKIAALVRTGDIAGAQKEAQNPSPIQVINELMRLSNLPIEISVDEGQKIIAKKNGGSGYSVAELSDGERNAFLIAANVLTAKAGTLILIDEPERHLHRSIISPLLTHLFAQRADCAFVVSTHDVMLPLDNPAARTLLVRGCAYAGQSVTSWDADLVVADEGIDEDLKRDILGGRRKLLFVEGEEHSLDKPLYSLLFPQVSVVGKSSCRDVEHAVSGVRDAEGLHWVHAFGIVDNDRRAPDDIDRLKAKGVYAVPAFSVESLYYHPDVQRRLADRQHALTGADAGVALQNARNGAVEAIVQHRQRLSERVVVAALRQELMSKLPKRSDVAAGQPIEVRIDVATVVAEEAARLDGYCDAKDLGSIVARYPIQETPALNQIASLLGFQNRRQYEEAVRKMLMDDPDALAFLQGLFGTLTADIAAG